jgi:hypothetical protein
LKFTSNNVLALQFYSLLILRRVGKTLLRDELYQKRSILLLIENAKAYKQLESDKNSQQT